MTVRRSWGDLKMRCSPGKATRVSIGVALLGTEPLCLRSESRIAAQIAHCEPEFARKWLEISPIAGGMNIL